MTSSVRTLSQPSVVMRRLLLLTRALNDYVYSRLPLDSSPTPIGDRSTVWRNEQRRTGWLLSANRERTSSSIAVSLLKWTPSLEYQELLDFRLWSSTDVPIIKIELKLSEPSKTSAKVVSLRPWSFSTKLVLEQLNLQPRPKFYLRASLTDGSTSGKRSIEYEGLINTGLYELLRFVLPARSTTPSFVLSELKRMFTDPS